LGDIERCGCRWQAAVIPNGTGHEKVGWPKG
jgi:hypothetical protein